MVRFTVCLLLSVGQQPGCLEELMLSTPGPYRHHLSRTIWPCCPIVIYRNNTRFLHTVRLRLLFGYLSHIPACRFPVVSGVLLCTSLPRVDEGLVCAGVLC